MWIHISKIAKTIVFPHKQMWKPLTSYFSAKPSTIIVENTENSPKSVILHNRMQISEKFSPIVSKIGISSSAPSIVLHTKRKLLTRKLSKQQLTAHTSIVKSYTAKCYKHAPISSKHTIVVTGVSKCTNIHTQNTIQTNLAHIVITI